MNFDLKLEIEPDNINLSNYKLERENDLKFFFDEKIKEKRKEWQEQVERAKWKVPVQARGLLKCKNGHHFEKDLVVCGKCHENLYWVDSDERYAICKGCNNNVMKMDSQLYSIKCGAEALAEVKWISGYKL